MSEPIEYKIVASPQPIVDGRTPRERADSIMRLFWDNFLRSESAFVMRDIIAIEIEKAERRGYGAHR